MRKATIKFWDKATKTIIVAEGMFHQWGSNYEEFHAGPGNYTVGIVELSGGRVVTPQAEDVHFIGDDVIFEVKRRDET